MNLDEARKLFVGTNDKIFLNAANMGLAPITAKHAIAQFLDHVVYCPTKDMSEHHSVIDAMKDRALSEASSLLDTHPNNLCLIESTSHGLNIAANSINFSQDDEVLICDTEYLQVAIPFVKKHEANKLKVVPITAEKKGHYHFSDFEKKITKNTKAIILSAVQWSTGQRVFSSQLGKLCKLNNIWLIIDGIQELGALTFDANLRYCDFYIAGGHKWLNSPYGCGVMYLSQRAQELEPTSYGYRNLLPPTQGWGIFFQEPDQSPFREYDFPKTAKSFGIGGTANYPGAIGLAEAMKIVNQIGRLNVEKRVLELTAFLRDQLHKMNISLAPFNDDELSGITTFRLFDTHEQDLKALNYLEKQRFFLSIRYTNNCGGLRVSCHYFNNEEDIIRLCDAIQDLKKK